MINHLLLDYNFNVLRFNGGEINEGQIACTGKLEKGKWSNRSNGQIQTVVGLATGGR